MTLANLPDLEAEWAVFMHNRDGNRNQWSQDQKWRADNPDKMSKLSTYRGGGARPDFSGSAAGSVELRMLHHLDAYAKAKEDGPIPPPPGLPFPEAVLRPGFQTVTIPDPKATSYTTPAGSDTLIDLGWVRREQALKIYVRAGQRVHIKNCWVDSIYLPGNSRGLSPYWRGGLGVRMAPNQTAGAEHVSITGYLATGPGLTDGFTIGGTSDPHQIGKVTLQDFRIENSSMVNGGKPAAEDAEHMDCFQAQGPFGTVEFGMGTMYRQWAPAGSHPGKGLMLNAYSANSRTYLVNMRKVNFRDYPAATNCGAVWIKDFNTISIRLEDVWSMIQGSPSAAWAWNANSSLFLNTAAQYGSNQGWTSSGTAPNRMASFPPVTNITGQVREGLPAGGDFVTRDGLGL